MNGKWPVIKRMRVERGRSFWRPGPGRGSLGQSPQLRGVYLEVRRAGKTRPDSAGVQPRLFLVPRWGLGITGPGRGQATKSRKAATATPLPGGS